MENNIQVSLKRFLKRPISRFEVVTFNWHANILGSRVWPYFQKLVNVGRRSGKFLEQMLSGFGYPRFGSKKIGQTVALSTAREVRQDFIKVMPREKMTEMLQTKEDFSASRLSIVFLHYSNSHYLKYSLAQARHSNPESTIYLLGDDTNDCYDFLEHRSFSDYFQEAHEFSKIYRHFNSTKYKYELFNFQRWFILEEFLVTNKIEKCLYLDSDTMLYTDVTEEQKKFAQFDLTLSYKTSGCTFFLNRVQALTDFCQFLTDIYTKKERHYYDRMLAQYATFKKNNQAGGACDMTAFDFYSYDHFGEIGEVAQIIDGSVYDPSINLPHPGFEMENGIKKIVWQNGDPYGIQLRTGKEIKFNTLQFQGPTKHLMARYYTGTNSDIGL
jgi:hypothetical protein